jgi:hypothetical protein
VSSTGRRSTSSAGDSSPRRGAGTGCASTPARSSRSGAGLGVLVAATLAAREQGAGFELVAASELFRRSIELTGLSRYVDPMMVS